MQEGFDLVRHALDRISHFADTVLDAADDVVDDVCAPLECLRAEVLDEINSGIEAVDNRILDCRDLLRHGIFHAVPDIRYRCFNGIQVICDRVFDAVPDGRNGAGNCIHHAGNETGDCIPYRRYNSVNCIQRIGDVIFNALPDKGDHRPDRIQDTGNKAGDRVPDCRNYIVD